MMMMMMMMTMTRYIHARIRSRARLPQIKDDDPFIGTLDYIFLSKEWRVKSVLPTVHRDNVKDGPYPNEIEPSDHIMIAADLLLPR